MFGTKTVTGMLASMHKLVKQLEIHADNSFEKFGYHEGMTKFHLSEAETAKAAAAKIKALIS